MVREFVPATISCITGTTAMLLVCLLFTPPIDAHASPSQQARKLAGGAAADFAAGRLPKAIEGYQAAYALVPNPELVYNLAQCLRLMGRHRDALAAYQRFLRLAPSTPHRATAEEHIRQLEGLFVEARQIANRASVYYARGQYEPALAAALRCTETAEWRQCWKIVGASRCKLGQPPGEALVRVDVDGAQLLRLPTVCGAMEVLNVP